MTVTTTSFVISSGQGVAAKWGRNAAMEETGDGRADAEPSAVRLGAGGVVPQLLMRRIAPAASAAGRRRLPT